jgi:competence protein ComEA
MGKDWWKIVFGVLCGLLAGGLILLVSSQPRGEAVRLEALPSPAPLLVHVAGEVANPGVYSLADGSRVQDAIQAAGGASAKADVQAINLAEMLEDGNWVTVPAQAPTETPTSITTGEPAETATPPATPT